MENAIRDLAYLKWEKEGCPSGRDLEFWLSAEKEIVKSLSQQNYTFTKPIHLTIQFNNQKHIISTKSWKDAYVAFLNFSFFHFGIDSGILKNMKISPHKEDCIRRVTVSLQNYVYVKTKYDANTLVKFIKNISNELGIRTTFSVVKKRQKVA